MNNWQPDTHLLGLLDRAVRLGDSETYLTALLETCVVMPTDSTGGWPTASVEDGTMLMVFTSIERLVSSPVGAQASSSILWPVLDLVHHWPNPEWSLIVDPLLESQVLLEPSVIEELVRRATVGYPLDAALRTAGDDPAAYLNALLAAEVVVPTVPGGSPSRDLSDPDFAWWLDGPGTSNEGIAIFSSQVRLQARLGDVPWMVAPFVEVLEHWPAGCAALVDPDHHLGRRIPGQVLDRFTARLAEAAQLAEAAAVKVLEDCAGQAPDGQGVTEPTEEMIAAARAAGQRAIEEFLTAPDPHRNGGS